MFHFTSHGLSYRQESPPTLRRALRGCPMLRSPIRWTSFRSADVLVAWGSACQPEARVPPLHEGEAAARVLRQRLPAWLIACQGEALMPPQPKGTVCPRVLHSRVARAIALRRSRVWGLLSPAQPTSYAAHAQTMDALHVLLAPRWTSALVRMFGRAAGSTMPGAARWTWTCQWRISNLSAMGLTQLALSRSRAPPHLVIPSSRSNITDIGT